MRANSVLAAVLATTASVASAEPARPRIYFPQRVKRQFTNATDNPETTKRESTFLESSPGSIFSSSSHSSDSPDSDTRVTTIIVASTIVSPSGVPTTKLISSVSTLSVPASATASDLTTPSPTSPSSPGGLGGLLSSILNPSDVFPPASSETPSATGGLGKNGTVSSSAAGTSSSDPPLLVLPTLGGGDSASSTSSSDAPLLVLPTLGGGNSASSTGASPASSSAASGGGLLNISLPLFGSSSSDSGSPTPTGPEGASSSPSGILIAPTGVVTPSPSSSDGNPLLPINTLLSSVVGGLTNILPTPNATDGAEPTGTADPSSPASANPDSSSAPGLGISLTLFPGTGATTTPVGTAPITVPTSLIDPSLIPNITEGTGLPTSLSLAPTDATSLPDGNATIPEPTSGTVPATTFHPTSYPSPTSVVTISPNGTTGANTTAQETATPVPVPTSKTSGGVTSLSPTATVTITQPWLPTTIVVDPPKTSSTTLGLAPTSAASLPTALPKAITPDSANHPPPADTTLIQIGFAFGMNYPFVVSNSKAAAQIFQLLPKALSYAGGFPIEKSQIRKLIPLNTQQSLGYVTTLAIVTYPSNMVETLRMDVKLPSSSLYSNPEQLVYNLTTQINPAIDIILGSYPEDGATASQGAGGSSATSTSGPNGDPFNHGSDSNTSAGQRGATAGIAFGVVGVAAAYGAAMFVIARRYKRRKQSHRRASSLSEPSSDMRTTTPSPALMGGALLSRDFSSYGGVSGGRDSGGRESGQESGRNSGRDSHGSNGSGSGRSGMNNSTRTAYISAPVAAENSLGWN